MCCLFFFFFNDTATTEIYTLSLHDALPIYHGLLRRGRHPLYALDSPNRNLQIPQLPVSIEHEMPTPFREVFERDRSEEHTSELQSRQYLVCRLLLEKKKITNSPPW